MSGIALIFQQDRSRPVARPDLEAMLGVLEHRGPDGCRVAWQGAAALGHRHFWTTPEEVGERQPVAGPDGQCRVTLDGRLDNRPELLRALAPGRETTTDARLVALAYARWGERCFSRLLGPFAVAIFDPRRRRVVCGRDALGDRTLFYAFDGRTFLAASEEQALLANPAVPADLDEETVAAYFALDGPRPGATFFAGVRELPPGHSLTLEDGRLELQRYWQPDPTVELRYAADADYAEHFRELLIDSVSCRMRGSSPPSVLMSGGLDSTPVAAIAARELRRGASARLRTVSWVFDELVEQDEREYMDPMVEAYGLDAIRVAGDGAWPLRDLDTWPVNPNAPIRDLYRLRERAYRASRRAGSPILLTGDFGDNLYCGYDFWLRDLLAEGRVAEALSLSLEFLASGPLPASRRLRTTVRAVLRALGWRGRSRRSAGWLTAAARRRLSGSEPVPRAGEARCPTRFRALFDPVNPHEATLEQSMANRMGVELRYPFRDRRLVEYMLSVPAHLVYRPGWFKWLVRRATRDMLPDAVRRRRAVTDPVPLCARGLAEREWEVAAELLTGPDAVWPRYVSSRWLFRGFPSSLRAGKATLETVIAWRCICMELWRRRVLDGGPTSISRPDLPETVPETRNDSEEQR